MTFGRKESGGNAIMVVSVDAPVPQECLREIGQQKNIDAVYLVRL